MACSTADLVIIGGGIVGLTLAETWRQQDPTARIVICEKEASSTVHGTGRNSGVLHSGIYYGSGSLRARLCVEGQALMKAYAQTHGLWLDACGKLLVPTSDAAREVLPVLLERGRANGVTIERVDGQTMLELEPRVETRYGEALWVSSTSVVNPKEIAAHLATSLVNAGISLCYRTPVLGIAGRQVTTSAGVIDAGVIVNAAGLHADRVAKAAGLQFRYSFQPFKGKYWMHKDPTFRLRRLVYPIPDLTLPFLGVHTAHNAQGQVFFGPSSTPILGRENYRGLEGVEWTEGFRLGIGLAKKLLLNTNGLRQLAWREAKLLTKAGVAAEVAGLVRGVQPADFSESLVKVGIRSQIFDPTANQLVNDFVILEQDGVVHILNAISPAFTASFAFARYVSDQFLTTTLR